MSAPLNHCTRCNGSGTEPGPLPDGEAVRAYMRSTGWTPRAAGTAGTLWDHPDRLDPIGVCHGIQPGDFEWRSAVNRVAQFEGRTVPELLDSVRALPAGGEK